MASKKARRVGKWMGKKNRRTARRSYIAGRSRLLLESLEPRHMMAQLTFVDVGSTEPGYKGTQDTVLFSISPDVNFGTDPFVSVDQQDVNGARQGLLKFGDIFTTTNESGKIPIGSTIKRATLTFSVFNESNSSALISLYPMLTDWDELDATWNRFRPPGGVGGVQASEGEAAALADATLLDPTSGTGKVLDVAASLRRWAAGDPNYGWLVESAATNGWDFDASESSAANRPKLTVDFTPPAGGNSGTFRFLDLTSTKTEGNTGTSIAKIRVARVGGVTDNVSVDYAITGGTATSPDDYVNTPGTLTFDDPAITIKEIEVTIKGDTSLEGLETIVLSLSNPKNLATPGVNVPTIDAGADDHTLTIADDDVLINEVLANIFNPTNASITEANREYVELIGTPNQNLAGYFFVVFEGEEEEPGAAKGSAGLPADFGPNVLHDAGRGVGVADLVIDLSPYSIGSNGLLVLTAANWAYPLPPGTGQAIIPGFALEDGSQTYALIRSATPIVQGRDYDTDGFYDTLNTTGSIISEFSEAGVGVGVLDKLPAGAQIVDSVGVLEGGGGDRDRVSTLNAPGPHIHQPIGNEGTVAPDAITRRFGDLTPNSSGPWYNGEITTDALTEIVYAPAPRQAVVTPPGARLTPGAPNGLTTVGFDVTVSSVAENVAGGKITVTVVRSTNEPSVGLTLNYSTSNGTAIAGQDYAAVSNGQITFDPNQLVATFDIDITNDTDAESFETFKITLSNAAAPYQIISAVHTVTIEDDDALKKTFQQGTNGYTGSQDATINSRTPDIGLGGRGTAPTIVVDEELGTFVGPDAFPSQGLIRFDNLFGGGLDQVPEGAEILGGFLKVNVVPTGGANANSQIRFFRMLKDWEEINSTWNEPQGSAGVDINYGITPDDVEATADPDFIVPNPAAEGAVTIPLNLNTLQAWANGVMPNFGWSIINDSGNSWEFSSTDDFLNPNAFAPQLTILYTDPVGQAGTFRFSDSEYRVNEGAGTATISVERVGGTTGAATLDWSVAAGTTGSLADTTGATSGQIVFNPGVAKQTFTIAINNDTDLERNEDLNLSLALASGAGAVDGASAKLIIRDNDLNAANPPVLLNELYINDPGNDGGHEFIELVGTPGAALGGLYLFVIDGDSGSGLGSADLVVDLGSYTLGSNGLAIIHGATGFTDFDVPAATTRILTPLLNTENLANDSTTFVLAYSPSSRLSTEAFDYDWDNDGDLDLPAGLVFVDSVANKDDSADDKLYGPGGGPGTTNVIDVFASKNYVPDAISRKLGNTSRNSATAWFHGDLVATGDDPLVYQVVRSTDLPLAPNSGTAVTPGEANTSAVSALVSMATPVYNPDGTFTLNFTAPVTQLLLGAGGASAGISITNRAGAAISGVNVLPNVSGVGTSAWTFSFAGPSVSGGALPPATGVYQLNFTGNNLIGNGRAVDADNTATAAGSNRVLKFDLVGPTGDYNKNGIVDTADYVVWRRTEGTPVTPGTGADGDGDGMIDQDDYNLWRANFGNASSFVLVPGAASGTSVAEATPAPLSPQEASVPLSAIDDVLVDWPTSVATFKVESTNATGPARETSGGATQSVSQLLLANRRGYRPDQHADFGAAAERHRDVETIDEVFSSLGVKRSQVREAVEKVACPV